MALLDDAKLALRIVSTAYDGEISRLLLAAEGDLGIVDVEANSTDPLLVQAMITYVRLHFGTPEDSDYLSKSYDEQKAQLISNRNYGLQSYIRGDY